MISTNVMVAAHYTQFTLLPALGLKVRQEARAQPCFQMQLIQAAAFAYVQQGLGEMISICCQRVGSPSGNVFPLQRLTHKRLTET